MQDHMENMRMDPKHQFATQYVLSWAAAEIRQEDVPGMPLPLHGGTGLSGFRYLGPMSHMGQNHPGLTPCWVTGDLSVEQTCTVSSHFFCLALTTASRRVF
ncbi:hypothetical protein JTE90_019878 [Oedothorax gibbosus]|uniref:Uncharacterized protein n=1 Tax=Oedothorax gibbosus TaxID=931172 RepID=A0AAV6VWR3_9ARAC|nr:hypothetical protein JTE90_019878 [Oedothorax gibbosus]